MSNKVYQMITDKILAHLENGVIPWQKTWKAASGAPKNFVTGKAYQGINSILLHLEGLAFKYASPYWLTFKQAKAKGGNVKKGQHGSQVIFWKITDKLVEDEDTGETKVKKNFILRYYTVFNLDQCEGIQAPVVESFDNDPIANCEDIVANMPQAPVIEFGGGRACYSPFDDKIDCPEFSSFINSEAFYSTMFHEMAHSTGHSSRLNRFENDTKLAAFGSEDYSKEELVAEMTAAFICGHAGIENKTLDNSAAYIHGWSKKLKDQPQMVIQAAAKAQKAADFILNA